MRTIAALIQEYKTSEKAAQVLVFTNLYALVVYWIFFACYILFERWLVNKLNASIMVREDT
jgi:hypothetical protein